MIKQVYPGHNEVISVLCPRWHSMVSKVSTLWTITVGIQSVWITPDSRVDWYE